MSHSCKPVCDSVHVPAQAMNPINPGAKWWKEPSLIAFFGWLTVVVFYAIFEGFHSTYAGDFGTFVTFQSGTLQRVFDRIDANVKAKRWT